jgi:hypothetical protein
MEVVGIVVVFVVDVVEVDVEVVMHNEVLTPLQT